MANKIFYINGEKLDKTTHISACLCLDIVKFRIKENLNIAVRRINPKKYLRKYILHNMTEIDSEIGNNNTLSGLIKENLKLNRVKKIIRKN